MKASEIASAAAKLVGGDRKEAYGDVADGLQKVADIWNGALDMMGKAPAEPLNAKDVGAMMTCLKLARGYTGPFRMDNWIDAAGWASVTGEAAQHLEAS